MSCSEYDTTEWRDEWIMACAEKVKEDEKCLQCGYNQFNMKPVYEKNLLQFYVYECRECGTLYRS